MLTQSVGGYIFIKICVRICFGTTFRLFTLVFEMKLWKLNVKKEVPTQISFLYKT